MNQIKQKGIIAKFIILLALAFIISANAGQASAAVRPNVAVAGFSIKEGQAEVGKDFTLSLELVNTEPSACALNVITTVQASQPFIMNGVGTIPSGDICAGNSRIVNVPLRIDPTATGGTYQVTINNNYETTLLSQFSSTNTINIFVSAEPQISAHIIDSNPIDVYAGDTAVMKVGISNNGAFQAQAVSATMASSGPIIVKWANSFSSLNTIDARQTKNALFTVEVPKDAKQQDYLLTLHIDYLDQKLERQSMDFNFTFSVKKKAVFETADAGSDTLYSNGNAKVVRITLKNTGTDTAFKIKAKIQPQYPFSTDGSVRYVNSLAPGESTPVEFVVDVDKDGTVGKYGLDMILDFEDAQGKKLQDSAAVTMEIKQKGIIRSVFLDFWYLWLIAAAIIVIVRGKKTKAKKTKGKQG